MNGFKVLFGDVCGLKYDTIIILGVPGGAPSYSLSVAWVSICEVLVPKRVLRCSLALFCFLPGYFQAFGFRLTKGFQVPFVILRTHSRVWMGSMLYKAFCLVYHGSHPNNHKHKLQLLHRFASKCYISNLQYIAKKKRDCMITPKTAIQS